MRDAMLRLRKWRANAGLSLKKVAADVGVSYVFLQTVELGKAPIAMKRWAKLAESLGVDPYVVARACVDAGPIRVDASGMTEEARRKLAVLLINMIEEGP